MKIYEKNFIEINNSSRVIYMYIYIYIYNSRRIVNFNEILFHIFSLNCKFHGFYINIDICTYKKNIISSIIEHVFN